MLGRCCIFPGYQWMPLFLFAVIILSPQGTKTETKSPETVLIHLWDACSWDAPSVIIKEIIGLWDSRPRLWICWPWRRADWFSLAWALEASPHWWWTSPVCSTKGSVGLCEESFLLLVPFCLTHQVSGPLNCGDRESDCGFYKRWPHWGFMSLWDDPLFPRLVRAVGGLNGDISILAWLIWLLDIGRGVAGTGMAGFDKPPSVSELPQLFCLGSSP